MSVGVCLVCVFSSHSFWTSSSLDVPGVTQEEGHTGFLVHLLSAVRALIFLARRSQPLIFLVGREVEFCVLTIQSFSTRGAFLFLFFIFLVRKIPFAGIELTSQLVKGLRGTSELPGRPALKTNFTSRGHLQNRDFAGKLAARRSGGVEQPTKHSDRSWWMMGRRAARQTVAVMLSVVGGD